jgi:AcrR family transcriptional regulator
MVTTVLEQKTKDKRFREREDEILRLFFEAGGKITVKELATKMGVPRSTIYRHHNRLAKLTDDYRVDLLEKCKNWIIQFSGDEKKFFRELLLFVYHNRKIILVFPSGENTFFFIEMMEMIKEPVFRFVGVSGWNDKLYNIYSGEVIMVIRMWGTGGFLAEEMDHVLKDILFLTDTARHRLGAVRFD